MCGIDAIHEIILHLHKLASHADIMMQRKKENTKKKFQGHEDSCNESESRILFVCE
jgi:hypothetical protein